MLRRLQAGDRLAAGDKLESSNGLSTALLQHDGNFVVGPGLTAVNGGHHAATSALSDLPAAAVTPRCTKSALPYVC